MGLEFRPFVNPEEKHPLGSLNLLESMDCRRFSCSLDGGEKQNVNRKFRMLNRISLFSLGKVELIAVKRFGFRTVSIFSIHNS